MFGLLRNGFRSPARAALALMLIISGICLQYVAMCAGFWVCSVAQTMVEAWPNISVRPVVVNTLDHGKVPAIEVSYTVGENDHWMVSAEPEKFGP